MKPIIGITTYGRSETAVDLTYYDTYYAVPAAYVDAVRRAGGIPVLLPVGEPDWVDVLAAVDGVVVTGGVDIDPTRYGGNPTHASLTQLLPERDAFDFALINVLVNRPDVPTLCICRGMQVLNVALGGSMHEHIPDIQPADIHRDADGWWAVQPLTAQPGSRVATAMQETEVRTYSGHHQAVKTVAPGLQVTATAPDGIIEALEHTGHPWLVGVQWHPECSAAADVTQQRLFDTLVAKARELRRRQSHNL